MERLRRLDGLRGVLAVYVMLGHALPYAGLPAWLGRPFVHGEAAVDLFFALSGLVIVFSLEHHGRALPFIAARARRLLPVYLLVLAVAAAMIWLPSPLRWMPWATGGPAGWIWPAGIPPHPVAQVAAHALLLHGLLPDAVLPYAWVTVLGPAWSLSAEWQFYLAIAWLLPLLPPTHRLRGFTLGMLALGAAWHVAAPHLPPGWAFSRAFLPDAAPYFCLGLGTAALLRGGGAGCLVLATVALAGLAVLDGHAAKAVTPLLWWLALAAQFRSRPKALARLLDARWVQYLGAISYPLYLVNEPVQRGLAWLLAPLCHGDAAVFAATWLPLSILAALAAAAALHHAVERPAWRGSPSRRGGWRPRLSIPTRSG